MPALTFWVMPELARVAGLRPVFADIDPDTFTLDPGSFERAIGPRHPRGRADAPVRPAVRHGRDHGDRQAAPPRRHRRLRARRRRDLQGPAGRDLRRRRDLQLPDAQAAERVRRRPGVHARSVRWRPASARRFAALPWPGEKRIVNRLRIGRRSGCSPGRACSPPTAFRSSGSRRGSTPTPTCICGSRSARSIRCRRATPNDRQRPGRDRARRARGTGRLDRRHAAPCRRVTELLKGTPGVQTPRFRPDASTRTTRSCVYTPARDEVVRRCIRRGIDIETLHVDVCSRLPLFGVRDGGAGRGARGGSHSDSGLRLAHRIRWNAWREPCGAWSPGWRQGHILRDARRCPSLSSADALGGAARPPCAAAGGGASSSWRRRHRAVRRHRAGRAPSSRWSSQLGGGATGRSGGIVLGDTLRRSPPASTGASRSSATGWPVRCPATPSGLAAWSSLGSGRRARPTSAGPTTAEGPVLSLAACSIR